MMDTVVLVFEQGMYTILDSTKFGYEDKTKLAWRAGFDKVTQNPTLEDYKNGVYKPRLTLNRRIAFGKPQFVLKVEFSVSKLIFSNNFDEVRDEDFERVVSTLYLRLKEMGVGIFTKQIEKAHVSAIHYSKNFIFTDGSTCSYFNHEIAKVNIHQGVDIEKVSYKNGGSCTKFHANSFELTFYDKKKDLELAGISIKRTEEQESSIIQLNLLEPLRRTNNLEIFRMEYRLNKRQKIKSILKKCEINDLELSFKSLFNSQKSKIILLSQLNFVRDNYPKNLSFVYSTPTSFISQFQAENPKASITDVMAMYGFTEQLKTKDTREIRESLKRAGNDSWYRFNKKINNFNFPSSNRTIFEPLYIQLYSFIPTRLANLALCSNVN